MYSISFTKQNFTKAKAARRNKKRDSGVRKLSSTFPLLNQSPTPTSSGYCNMGNYRFKFSDMIPNAWFYKLRDFTKQPTRNFKNITKKKLHHHNSSVSNPVPLNSPAHTTSPSSSSRDKQSQYQRKSYYFTREVNQPASPIHDASSYHRNGRNRNDTIYKEADGIVLQPARRSSKKRRSTRRSRASPRLVTSSIPAGYSCRSTIESVKTINHPDSTSQEYPNSAAETSSETESILQPIRVVTGVTTSTDTIDRAMLSSCTWSSKLEHNIINNLKNRPPARQFVEHVDDMRNPGFDSVSLPSIKTKGIDIINNESEPTIIRMRTMKFGKRNVYGSLPESMKIVKNDEKSSPQVKRFSVSSHSPGVKLRTNSPRIVTRRIHGRKSISPRRSLSESFAIVKSSKDPEKDFRDSMVEMIVEFNIWSSKELEDLLTCYLSLNSYKYHDIIIRVFKQIWFEFVHAE